MRGPGLHILCIYIYMPYAYALYVQYCSTYVRGSRNIWQWLAIELESRNVGERDRSKAFYRVKGAVISYRCSICHALLEIRAISLMRMRERSGYKLSKANF